MKRFFRLLSAATLVAPLMMTASPSVANPTQVTNKLSIVQIGDSYSAGNGAGSYYGPGGCLRSSSNWGQQFAAMANGTGISTTYENHACSGAKMADVFGSQVVAAKGLKPIVAASEAQAVATLTALDACGVAGSDDVASVDYKVTATGNPTVPYTYGCELRMKPQADAIKPTTDLVLMTIGGNDALFTEIVGACFAPRVPGIFDGYDGATCGFALSFLDSALPSIIDQSEPLLKQIISTKMAANPNSKIVFMGYPLLATNDPFLRKAGDTTVDAAAAVRGLSVKLATLQKAVVDRVNAQYPNRVIYLPQVAVSFAGHEGNPDLNQQPLPLDQ